MMPKTLKMKFNQDMYFCLDIKGKTEEEIMAGFKQKWRYNIRLAGRKGVTVKEGTKRRFKKTFIESW